jgi:hypothetical protein
MTPEELRAFGHAVSKVQSNVEDVARRFAAPIPAKYELTAYLLGCLASVCHEAAEELDRNEDI